MAADDLTADLMAALRERRSAVLQRAGGFPVIGDATQVRQEGESVTLGRGRVEIEINQEDLRALLDREERMKTPVRDWPEELLELWQHGMIWIRDEASVIPDSVRVRSAMTLIRDSTIGEYCVLDGELVLIDETTLGSHNVLQGPVALWRSDVEHHCVLASMVLMDSARCRSFVRMAGCVRVGAHTAIGSHSGLLGGGYHLDRLPLRPGSFSRGGVEVGAHCWLGQSVSLLGGTQLRRGVTVAAGVSLAGQAFEHALVVGSPPKALPLDANLFGMTEEEAFSAGMAQGAEAALLSFYGPAQVERSALDAVRIRYPRHPGLDRDRALLVRFHAGALRAYLADVLGREVSCLETRIGEALVFEARFDAPLGVYRKLDDALELGLDGALPLAPEVARALDEKVPGLSELCSELVSPCRVGDLEWDGPLLAALRVLSRQGLVTPRLFFPPYVDHLEPEDDLTLGLAAALRAPAPSEAMPFEGELASPTRPPASNQATASPAPGGASAAGLEARIREQLEGLLGRALVDDDAPFYSLGLDSVALAVLSDWFAEELGIEDIDPFRHNSLRRLSAAAVLAAATRRGS